MEGGKRTALINRHRPHITAYPHPQVEAFFYGLKDVPQLPTRAGLLAFRAGFAARAADAERKAAALAAACAAVTGSTRLPRVVAAVRRLVVEMAGGATAAEPPRVTLATLPTLKAVTDASGSRTLLAHVVAHLTDGGCGGDTDAAALGADGELVALTAAVALGAELDALPADASALVWELRDAEAAAARGLAVAAAAEAPATTVAPAGDVDALAPEVPLPSFLSAARLRVDALSAAATAARAAYASMLAAYGDDAAAAATTAAGGAQQQAKPSELLRALQVDFVAEFGRVRAALARQRATAAAKAAAAAAGGGGAAGARRW